jgi:CDP-diacylglycerol--serine O-phosphatidyltransferase
MFFKTKDLMTVGNIGGGLAAVIVSMEGMSAAAKGGPDAASTYVFWAAACIMIAWTFDAFDGVVARALGQMNEFGAEFDNVADLVAYSVAPSFILYLAYRHVADLPGLGRGSMGQTILAAVLSLVPAVFGCIRFARFNLFKLDLKGIWIGFPRPAAALVIIALVNSHLWPNSGIVQWLGVPLVVFLGFMNLSRIPFIGHHGRRFTWYLAIILNGVWMTVVIAVVLGLVADLLGWMILPPNFAFDWVLIWLSCYLFIAWFDIPTATVEKIRELTSAWNE